MAKMFDAVIVGAGPAGCACASWLKQLGFSPLLVDRQDTCGGLQLRSTYPNSWIPSSPVTSTGVDIAQAMHRHVVAANVDLSLRTEVARAAKGADGFSVELLREGGKEVVTAKSLVLAGGVVPRSAGIAPAENIFIGVSPAFTSCVFSGKSVAILGGGDTAVEAYVTAKENGAGSVRIFARRDLRAQKKKRGDVDFNDVEKGDFHFNQAAMTVNDRRFDYVVVMFGYEVSPAALLGLDVRRRQDGYVETDRHCATNIDGVFAIGEMTGRAHPCCVTAMADGVVAAKALQSLLEA